MFFILGSVSGLNQVLEHRPIPGMIFKGGRSHWELLNMPQSEETCLMKLHVGWWILIARINAVSEGIEKQQWSQIVSEWTPNVPANNPLCAPCWQWRNVGTTQRYCWLLACVHMLKRKVTRKILAPSEVHDDQTRNRCGTNIRFYRQFIAKQKLLTTWQLNIVGPF